MTEEYKASMAKRIYPILKSEIDALVQLPHELIDKTDALNDACWFLLKVDTQGLDKKYPAQYVGCRIAFNGLDLTRQVTSGQLDELVKIKAQMAQMIIADMLRYEKTDREE